MFIPSLVTELLNIHPLFHTPEQNIDDDYCEFSLNTCASCLTRMFRSRAINSHSQRSFSTASDLLVTTSLHYAALPIPPVLNAQSHSGDQGIVCALQSKED